MYSETEHPNPPDCGTETAEEERERLKEEDRAIEEQDRLDNQQGAYITDLLGLFPKHKCGLHLQHNDHRNVYEPVGQWIVDNDWCTWENEEAKQRAIETDEIWTVQWYPDTPVGFYALAAPTFEELLKLANNP